MKSKHPDEYNSKIKVAKHQRINVEEVKLIAKAKAQAIIDGLDICKMNSLNGEKRV